MPIFLRTFAKDNNPAGASQFVGFAVPVGVTDGDLIVVGITLPGAGITVTPPSDDWTPIAQTDTAVSPGIVAFWKIALNEPAHWVFSLSSSIKATGGALVYGGTDPSSPVEAFSVALTASDTDHDVASISPSLGGEEVIVFVGANTNGSYTPATGFVGVLESTQSAGSTLAAHHRQAPAAGTIAAFTVTFDSSAKGASLALVLRPGVGKLSIDDVRRRLIRAFPEGVEDVYDLTPSGDYYKLFTVIAAVTKLYGYDLIDLLRQESFPGTAYYRLPDWERLLGLDGTRTARLGTISQRQAQVVAAWRLALGTGSSIPEIRAAVAPLLGYDVASDIEIIETPRAVLTSAHTYASPGSYAIPGPGSVNAVVIVPDSAKVSSGGAQILLTLTHPSVEDLSVTLTGPTGDSYTWNAGSLGSGSLSGDDRVLRTPELAGAGVGGSWTVTITSTGASGTADAVSVFVEGIGRDWTGHDGLGAAIFDWGVFVDPTLINHGGGGAVDYAAIQRIIERFSQSHDIGRVIRGSATVNPGTAAIIPGDPSAIPGQMIPG